MNNSTSIFSPGQRWISEPEQNLGIGIVKKVESRRVEIFFPASEETRLYSISTAPIKRVEFSIGDTVESRNGSAHMITSVTIENNTFIYHSGDIKIHESELKDSLNFSSPLDRLNHFLFDSSSSFDLRFKALKLSHEIYRSPVRGFIGPRIDLIDHQLYVSERISSSLFPRALLSDETGLGKTIEACLVLHRLLLTGRIKRVLILLPDSLILQWFIELLRRFNLVFQIIDRDFIDSREESEITGNIFNDEQLCLVSLDFLSSISGLSELAIEAAWDLLIVDEAHHLVSDSKEYSLVKELGNVSSGMLLLTATPEQFGYKNHYDRLHLLDPERYFNYENFLKEEEKYLGASLLIDDILSDKKPDESLLDILNISREDINNAFEDKTGFIESLLDLFGPGRVIYQNTRKFIQGFPDRVVHLEKLENTENAQLNWLVLFLKQNPEKKILCITKSQDSAIQIEKALRLKLHIETALFHEGLNLLQRDQNVARFSNPQGARVLISSEIGSEGRNFQFAQDLVLFDLPLNPELLEQRIGRLDRIGQKNTIHIHVPYLPKTDEEILARWYNEGLNLFEKNLPGVYSIYAGMEEELKNILQKKENPDLENRLENLIEETRKKAQNLIEKNEKGRDHLLALNSFEPGKAEKIKNQILEEEKNSQVEDFMHLVFENFGIEEDYISDQTFKLNLSLLTNETFPLPVVDKNNIIVTFDRQNALIHENYEFLNPDHPMVTNTLEFLLSSESGNCSLGSLKKTSGKKGPLIILETVYILECLAPSYLQSNRYLPPVPIRSAVNHLKADCEDEFSESFLLKNIKDISSADILHNQDFKNHLLPGMTEMSLKIAESKITALKQNAVQSALKESEKEIERLVSLSGKNNNIDGAAISRKKMESKELIESLENSRLRLDSIRLILSDDLS